ncbi:MAG: hypothetical protein ACREQN_11520 [Candidatus Binataceae bacterium]
MSEKHLQLELPNELWDGLERVAKALGIASAAAAALIALADWVSRHQAELDNRDPNERYFVNEALDALEAGRTRK